MPSLDARAIGARIRATRKARFWLQRDLAAKTKLSPGAIGAYEAGLRIPCRDAVVALSFALRRTLDWLLLGRCGRRKGNGE